MTTEMTTATPSTAEAAALAAHNKRKSSRAQVYDAILELSDSETPAKAPDIARVTGLTMAIVYDSIKALKQRGLIYSDNGVFYASNEVEETQAVSQTILADGGVKLEKGDQVLTLNQRETRALAKTLVGYVEQATAILVHHRQTDQQATIRRMYREMQQMRAELDKLAPRKLAQVELVLEA